MEELQPSQPPARKRPRPSPRAAAAALPQRRPPFPLRGLGLFLLRRLATILIIVVVIVFTCHLCLALAARSSPEYFSIAPPATGTTPSVWSTLGAPLAETGHYLWQLLQGSLGNQVGSLAIPVWETLRRVYARSMVLLGTSILLGGGLGFGTGVFSARRRHNTLGTVTAAIANLGTATPSFFLAIFLQAAVLFLGWRFLPLGGMGRSPGEALRSIILPVVVLAVRPFAYMAQVTHAAVAEALDADYARTAQAKGLAWPSILSGHVLRNALVPILTTGSNTLRFSLSSLPVVEVLFGRDGLGRTLVLALQRRDAALTTGLVLSMAVTFFTISVLLEITYRLLDPRLREAAL